MRRACFCYSTNENYMGATVLSAIQARRQLGRDRGEVMIVLLGPNDGRSREFAAICAQHGILFRCIGPDDIDGLPIHFARHFLDRFVDPDFTDLVHVDGDTQIVGSLDPLLELPLPMGRVIAVPDPMSVMIHRASRPWRSLHDYFRDIGIPVDRIDRYFNSGLFRINRSDAGAMGRETVRLWRERGAGFRFSEQDAFNIAFGDVTDLVSFRWNFPVFFLNGGYDASIQPHVIHFMSNPRPWQGAFAPWGRPAHRLYGELAEAHPELATLLQPIRGLRAVKYAAQQQVKRVMESRIWTRAPVRDRVARFEREAIV